MSKFPRNKSAEASATLQNVKTKALKVLQHCKMLKHFRWSFCKPAKRKNISAQGFAALQNVETFPLKVLQICEWKEQIIF
jgi:hypothetical protein